MNLDDLLDRRQEKGYSIDMMAALLETNIDSYLELEYGLRIETIKEQEILAKLFPEK